MVFTTPLRTFVSDNKVKHEEERILAEETANKARWNLVWREVGSGMRQAFR